MTYQETVFFRGKPRHVDAVAVDGQVFIVSDGLIRIASLKREWHEDVRDPESVVRALKDVRPRVDMLKFWQRVPESDAKFDYFHEWRGVAAIPISTYQHWWDKQINRKVRNMVRKSEKQGVVCRQVELDDRLIQGIVEIFNESPVRRGKPFWHYGKNAETVRAEMSLSLDKSVFVAAYAG